MKSKSAKIALLAAIFVTLGMLVGYKMQNPKHTKHVKGINKLQEVYNYIRYYYVDPVDEEAVLDNAIVGMLKPLDPYSIYIPAKEVQAKQEDLQGSFDGIGVEFNIIEDTVFVVAPIVGGPSEEVGIKPGDRIIKVDDKNFAGIGIKNEMVFKALRGPRGTKVKVTIKRRGVKELLEFTITRARIPLNSVEVSYMLNEQTGYMHITRFSADTHQEMVNAIKKLQSLNCQNLIIDLRSNPGGYLGQAVDMIDEFIDANKLIVYTKGRADGRKEYRSTAGGLFENKPIVVLVDEGSASASEIFSGAVQDLDRGLIVGRRTHGKGLVQSEKMLSDGSAMRLTVARYYTPSGRSIQTPYKGSERLKEKIIDFSKPEKIPDSLKYRTLKGRIVYGGGGILPDYYVEPDTAWFSLYAQEMYLSGVFTDFSVQYTEKHPDLKLKYPDVKTYDKKFEVTKEMLDEVVAMATKMNVKYNPEGFKKAQNRFKETLKELIAYRLFGREGRSYVAAQHDEVIQKALEVMPKAKQMIN
ncbi:MAG: S41 family peptidase [Bacteroidia bacterium]|nr:S41 family peptidase [Bacteroidia bacterium]MDW8302038.1 S41 family peptidase [Bacteroidia bacterium]